MNELLELYPKEHTLVNLQKQRDIISMQIETLEREIELAKLGTLKEKQLLKGKYQITSVSPALGRWYLDVYADDKEALLRVYKPRVGDGDQDRVYLDAKTSIFVYTYSVRLVFEGSKSELRDKMKELNLRLDIDYYTKQCVTWHSYMDKAQETMEYFGE